MKKIRILADVFATDGHGNPSIAMAAGSLHDETPDATRQLAIGNAEQVDVEATVEQAVAEAPVEAPAAETPAPRRATRTKA